MITSGYPQPGRPHTQQFVKRQAEFLRAAGVEVDVFDFRGRQKLRHYVTGWTRVRSRLGAGRYDLVHAQFGQSGLLALPKRLPLVVTLRGDDVQGIIDDVDGRIGLKGRILQRISQWGASHADSVIVVSEHMRAFLDPLVVTSVQQGSHNAVTEALACILPLVSAAVGDVHLRVRGVAECEVCGDDRPETIATGLGRVLRSGRRSNARDALKDLDEASL